MCGVVIAVRGGGSLRGRALRRRRRAMGVSERRLGSGRAARRAAPDHPTRRPTHRAPTAPRRMSGGQSRAVRDGSSHPPFGESRPSAAAIASPRRDGLPARGAHAPRKDRPEPALLRVDRMPGGAVRAVRCRGGSGWVGQVAPSACVLAAATTRWRAACDATFVWRRAGGGGAAAVPFPKPTFQVTWCDKR
eukprot:352129-Chlamydomonas_euryale.AAC.4